MNVLIITPQLYPCETGGIEIFNYHLIKELAKRGHRVWVLTCCGYSWNDRNVSLVRLNEKLLLNPTLSTLFHIFLEVIVLRKQIDVIHVPYTDNSILATPMLLVKRFLHIPYIIMIHSGEMLPWKPETLQNLYFRHADAIAAVSNIIREEYEKRSGRKIKVIAPLIPFIESKIPKEELRKRYGFGSDDKIILAVGSIKKIKGSDTLLNAFLDLGKTYVERNNLKLLYAGEGPMKPILAGKVKERSFDRYVKFLGIIPHEEVPHLYKIADIYVIPSLFEGAPVSLLEAMFNGLAIIGTDANGISNLIKHGKNGLLFEKENAKDLTEKIKELVENTDLSNTFREATKKARACGRDKFECVVSEHIKLYEGLADKKND